ncbi:nitrous oxide-stimulated promoter family protein [Bacteroides sp. GM023]|uniref:nitrous oxide-stimulated promoter family protein n=1 Tax=Bacteroides sp. GM023 TaxID=2723058 RepID=UPI00168BDC3A|nr:nitrous oxide-stimulated promoter family protein [Bacteroides sp. GM023]MBD3591667.1 nitrous oxide-stimulated promoter family protein [Bacteroides sp. GM023]
MKWKKQRIAHEKKVVELMIRIYCRKKEKNADLCPDCEELLCYAHARLDRCPFGEKKSSCKKCTVHCYKPAMRERMRLVMRFSGPRMMLYAPWEALRHLLNL